MNLTDDEIRAALEHVASQAPDPARVRAHLSARTRRHRQRRVLLMAGGAVGAAVAIGGPAVVLSRRKPPPAPASPSLPDVRTWPNLPSPTPEPAPAPGTGRVPLRYRPAYLPEDFLEVFRIVAVDGHVFQAREWHHQDPRLPEVNPGAITLTLDLEGFMSIEGRSREITVNGAPGWLTPPDAEVQQVVWPVWGGLSVSVEARHMDDGWTVVQEVARSVELDYLAGLEVPMAFGQFLPYLGREQRMTVEPDGDAWVATLSVLEDTAEVMSARLGAHVLAPSSPDAHEMQLRGRSGIVDVARDGRGGSASVVLDSGLTLVVSVPGGSDPVTEAELVQATNEMTIGSAPYVGWLWQR
jgi:hypothetical protein